MRWRRWRAEQPAQAVRAALLAQGWQSGRPVAVISDGKPALLNLVHVATGEPVRHLLGQLAGSHLESRTERFSQRLLLCFGESCQQHTLGGWLSD